MALLRVLVIAAIIWLIYRMIKGWMTRSVTKKSPTPHIDNIVRCKHCGLHIPEREAIRVDDGYYCSKEHHRLGSQ